jgi:hypothetical protein
MIAYFVFRMAFGNYRKWKLTLKYYKRRGRRPDFDNPTDISEYIMANILYERNDAFAPYADKVLVRDYVISKGLGHILPKCYGVWDSASQVEWDKLPEKFAMKANHGCGYNLICRDGSNLDRKQAGKKLAGWMRRKGYGALQTHYKKIEPKLFAEEFIDQRNGGLPVDYKFMCIKGEPVCIFLCTDRDPETKRVEFYVFDTDWNHLVEYQVDPHDDADRIAKPKNLEAMKEYARILSRDFDFVRVDLYDTGDRVWFGEMTFTPDVGKLSEYSTSALRKMYDMLKAGDRNS